MSTEETVIDKNSDKYKILLKLINKILTNIEKDEIDDLQKFINIDRDDIIKDVNIATLKSMENELFNHYSKYKCGYYKKSTAFVLNCLRGMVKELGYQLTYIRKDIGQNVNGKSLRRTHTLYSIK